MGREKVEILDSYKAGEWRTIVGWETEAKRYVEYARATFKKDKRVNIRISSRGLEEIPKRTLEEGIPYQILIASILHKYLSGRLVEHRVPTQRRTSLEQGMNRVAETELEEYDLS